MSHINRTKHQQVYVFKSRTNFDSPKVFKVTSDDLKMKDFSTEKVSPGQIKSKVITELGASGNGQNCPFPRIGHQPP